MPTNENACYLILDDGGHPLTVRLDDNESAAALKALLANGPVTLPASNYPLNLQCKCNRVKKK